MENQLLIEAPKTQIVTKIHRRVGRPTKYDPLMVIKADEYLDECVDEEYDYQTLSGKSDGFQYRIRVKLPSLESFARYLQVNVETMREWAKIYPEFSAALMRITELQKIRLMEGGISNSYNPIMAKFILSANHGMSENTKNETTIVLPKPIMELPEKDVQQNNSN